jgi:biopolymer transport protein ExbB
MAGLMLVLVVLKPSTGVAQTGMEEPTSAEAQQEATTDELRDQLDQLKQQLAEARQSLEKTRQKQKSELTAKRQRQEQLAGELFNAEARRQTLQQQTADLKAQRQQLKQQQRTLRSHWQQMRGAGQTAAEQLTIHLRHLPGREAAHQQARRWQKQLAGDDAITKAGDTAATQPTDEASAPLIALADQLHFIHRQASHLTLRRSKIWTANGQQRRVELLSIGHVAFAYRHREGDPQFAVSVAAPAEASGFRWQSDLPKGVESRLQATFDQMQESAAPQAGRPLAVPMDVTGQIQADTQLTGASLTERLRAGGYVMWPLGGVAVLALLLILERLWRLHGRNRGGARLADRVIKAAEKGDYDQALAYCQEKRNAQARVLAACLQQRAHGQHAMEDAIQEQLMHEGPRLQRWLGGLAVLAAVAPLLGLLGTVTGIIETFSVIRAFGSTSPSLMAGGISEALLTTATGLSLAIPILLIHSALKGRADRLIADSEKHAATLLNVLVYAAEAGGNGQTAQKATANASITPEANA